MTTTDPLATLPAGDPLRELSPTDAEVESLLRNSTERLHGIEADRMHCDLRLAILKLFAQRTTLLRERDALREAATAVRDAHERLASSISGISVPADVTAFNDALRQLRRAL